MSHSVTADQSEQSTPAGNRNGHRDSAQILTPGFLGILERDSSDSGFAASAEQLIADAGKARATDIHLDPREDSILVRFRIDGVLYDAIEIPKSEGLHVVRHLQVSAGIDSATKPDVCDGHVRIDTPQRAVNLRVASIPAVQGDKLSIRILDPCRTPFELETLGLAAEDEAVIRNRINQPEGMLLVTGPTGSGKTTTLYALLNEMAVRNRNIISLEDPVELTLDSITQVQVGHRATPTSVSFASGLTRLLRHDPDIIAVGEIRSDETAETAVDIALSGHPLLSSLNARDAAGTVSLLRNLGIKQPPVPSPGARRPLGPAERPRQGRRWPDCAARCRLVLVARSLVPIRPITAFAA